MIGIVETPSSISTVEQHRYTDAEQAGVYLYWRTVGGRSIRKTAKKFSIGWMTIKNWIERDDWINRANDDDQDDYGSSHIGVASIVVNELVPSIETAVQLRDHSNDDKVRLSAAQWLAGLAGVSPVNRVETSVIQPPNHANVIDIQSLVNLSPDELMAREQAARSKLKRS